METPFLMTFPANWKTSLFGFITVVSLFIVSNPALISSVIGEEFSKRIFSIAALVAGFITFWNTKDKNVTGGNKMQTMSGATAKEGTQSLVDATVKASVASGESVPSDVQRKANS